MNKSDEGIQFLPDWAKQLADECTQEEAAALDKLIENYNNMTEIEAQARGRRGE